MKLELSREILNPLTFDEKISYFYEQLVNVGFLTPETGIELVHNMVKVFKAQGRISYNPPTEVAPLRIALFRTEKTKQDNQDKKPFKDDPTWGWGQFTAGPVDIYDVPGDHFNMMIEPQVKVLADRLRECLDDVHSET